jgi:hypothetical protein
MKRLKGCFMKKLWIIVGSVFLVLVIAIVALWMVRASIVSLYLSHKMHLHISVASITPRTQFTKMSYLRIANPRRSEHPTAFSVKKIIIRYEWKQLWQTPTVIDSIEFNHVFLDIDFYNPLGTENNWTHIIAKMQSGQNSDKNKKHEYIVRRLVLNDVHVRISGMGLKGLVGEVENKHIAKIELHNINSQDGFPTEQLIRAIFGSMGLEKYIKDLLNPPKILKDVLSPIFKGLKGIFSDEREQKKEKPQIDTLHEDVYL